MSFSNFLRERKYLHNVTPATLDWYGNAFKWLRTESPSKSELNDAVIRMRVKGLRPTGCNSLICAINSYLKWSDSPERVSYLKEEERILPTFSLSQVGLLTRHKPKGRYPKRLHLIIL